LRPSCYNCRFKTLYRQSDITLGDFWGIQNVIPEMDDDKGTSLVLVNSTTGSKMLEQINSKVICRNVDVNRVIKYNPAAIRSVKHKDGRKYFLNKIDKESFDILVKKYCADSIWEKIKEKAEMVIGIVLEKMGLLCLVKKALGRD
jgi:hypothetical protein